MKTFKFGESKIFLHQDDLPAKIKTPKIVAVDTETTGLSLIRDRLCLIQFAFSKEECHLVQFSKKKSNFNTKNLEVLKILNNRKIQKIFHYARFDVAVLTCVDSLKSILLNLPVCSAVSVISSAPNEKSGSALYIISSF